MNLALHRPSMSGMLADHVIVATTTAGEAAARALTAAPQDPHSDVPEVIAMSSPVATQGYLSLLATEASGRTAQDYRPQPSHSRLFTEISRACAFWVVVQAYLPFPGRFLAVCVRHT